jgi:insulysin
MLKRDVNLMAFIIQSDVKCPFFLRERVAAFLESLKEKLEMLTDEEYAKYVESIRSSWLQRSLNLAEETNKVWPEIYTRKFLFDRSNTTLY